jgi:hypothetical protein
MNEMETKTDRPVFMNMVSPAVQREAIYLIFRTLSRAGTYKYMYFYIVHACMIGRRLIGDFDDNIIYILHRW